MRSAGPTGRRVLEAAILAMAGLVASAGVTFGCLVRNLILYPDAFAHNWSEPDPASAMLGRLPGTGIGDMAISVVLALLMFVWLWAVFLFVRREPRSPLTWGMIAVVVGPFLWSCWQAWRLAYPVCNAM